MFVNSLLLFFCEIFFCSASVAFNYGSEKKTMSHLYHCGAKNEVKKNDNILAFA